MLLTTFRFIWPSFRVEGFRKTNQQQELPVGKIPNEQSTNQQQELPVSTMFAKGSGLNEQIFIEGLP